MNAPTSDQSHTLARVGSSTASVHELFQRADRALQTHQLEEAEPIYHQLLKLGYMPGLVLYRLGILANIRRDFKAAWDLHCRAIAVDPALASKITPPEFAH